MQINWRKKQKIKKNNVLKQFDPFYDQQELFGLVESLQGLSEILNRNHVEGMKLIA